jgi:GDP-4-dehydro-6-deoxy-D-mannose reductase
MRVLISGISGFTGRQLATHLRAAGARVFGLSRTARDGVDMLEADVRDDAAVRAALRVARPEVVFHLAGRRPRGVAELREALDVNVWGTVRLLEAVLAEAPGATVLVAGSSAVYGAQTGDVPLAEELPPRPATLYGVSKAAQETAALRYHVAKGLRVIATRTFNVIGPGEGADTVAGAVARQVAAIEVGAAAPTVRVGRLSGRRDVSDVRDVVRAYELLARRGRPGSIYNVCSGRAVEVRALVEALVGLGRVPVAVSSDSAPGEEADVPLQIGDPGRLRAHTGWAPAVPLDTTLRDLLDDCRRRVAPSDEPKERHALEE